VPLLVVSAYTPHAHVSNLQYDFGSILRFVQGVFNIPEGSLGFADARATTDLSDFFNFGLPARPAPRIKAPRDANFFLHDTRPPEPPDTD